MLKFILIAIMIFTISDAFGYQWPLESFNQQHQINAALGEYRNDRFHNGVDIQVNAGINVYSVVDGIVAAVYGETDNSYMVVRDTNGNTYRYVHIVPLLEKDDRVKMGVTVIGTIKNIGAPHLHFSENDGSKNPLREGGLTPFKDDAKPVINNVDFWKQETNEQLTTRLYGHIDIRVNAYDPRTSATGDDAGGNCGIYKISIEFWQGGKQIGNKIEYIKFDKIPSCSVDLVYDTDSTMTNFYYWATNDPFNEPYNKYWNSNQRTGSDYTVDARVPMEALYGESNLLIKVIAEDIKGNQAVYSIGKQ